MSGRWVCGRGDLDGALEDLDRAVALGPQSPRADTARGNVRLRRDEHDAAIADYTRAVEGERGRRKALPLGNRALAHRREGDLAAAIADFDRALSIVPDHAEMLHERGRTKARAGDLEGAVADVRRALELEPEHEGARALLRELGEAPAKQR